MNKTLGCVLSVCLSGLLLACSDSGSRGNKSGDEDVSPAGIVAGSIGGALSLGEESGAGSPPVACPAVTAALSKGCNNVANGVELSYVACQQGTTDAVWNGILNVSVAGAAPITCGSFSSLGDVAAGKTVQRQFVANHTPGTSTRLIPGGTLKTIDHVTDNLANFDNAVIAPNIGTGYGSQISLDGTGRRQQLTVKQRVFSDAFDYSVVGSVPLSDSGSTRTIDQGSVQVYVNRLNVMASVALNKVVYANTCCHPVSGSMTATYSAGASAPTPEGSALVGKTETLTFNGCGTADLTTVAGTKRVSELNCL